LVTDLDPGFVDKKKVKKWIKPVLSGYKRDLFLYQGCGSGFIAFNQDPDPALWLNTNPVHANERTFYRSIFL
jgi:hypothetical protein